MSAASLAASAVTLSRWSRGSSAAANFAWKLPAASAFAVPNGAPSRVIETVPLGVKPVPLTTTSCVSW